MHILQRPRLICDFETYSELDVRDVGAWRYAEHDSTEILCLSYGAPGQKKKIWYPGLPFPQEIIDHVNAGYPIEAHNCMFEWAIWYCILAPTYGVPNPKCWLDTMASCAYRGLPLGLEDVGSVLNLDIQKDKRGKLLLQKLSKPRKPTKKDPSTRCRDENLLKELYEYCMTDSEAEDNLGMVVEDLPAAEFAVWVLDQRINRRGVYVDMEAVLAALYLVDIIKTNLETELRTLTDNKVETGTQTARMLEWFNSQGVNLDNLQAGTIENYLDQNKEVVKRTGKNWLPDAVVRVMEIRQQLSRASTSKLIKFKDCTTMDSRIRGLLQYHGAGTGRWAGRLVQPQNFPRGSVKDMDLLIATIKLRDIDILTAHYGDPMEAIASALRGMFIATPGKKLYVADFAAIEARVVMWLAGQMDALEAFHKFDRGEGPDIYCVTASKIYQRPIDKKKDPDERQLGKITVLGCFGPETRVLTDKGIKHILDICLTDKVWDGIEWVTHAGTIYQGKRETIEMMGVQVTPEHQILTQKGWVEAITVAERNAPERYQALELASENSPYYELNTYLPGDSKESSSNALAGQTPTQFCSITCSKERVLGVVLAPRNKVDTGESDTSVMPTLYQTKTTESGYSTEYPLVSVGVTENPTKAIDTMELGVSMFGNLGLRIGNFFSRISSALKGGISHILSLTESTWTKDTSRVTCALYQSLSTSGTRDRSQNCNSVSSSLKDVYDIALAGPRNRFTIITDEGPLIVHNCGYQMSGPRLQEQARDSYGVDVTLEMANKMVTTFRTDYDKVPVLWKSLEDNAIRTVRFKRAHEVITASGARIVFRYERDKAANWLTMELPNGRKLWYYEPGLEEKTIQYRDKETGELKEFTKDSLYYQGRNNKKGGIWSKVFTYGGMLTENAVQAIARDLMVAAMFRVEAAGYSIVMSVHDELVAEAAPDRDIKEFEKLVAGPVPAWAKGCPVAAEGWAGWRYRK